MDSLIVENRVHSTAYMGLYKVADPRHHNAMTSSHSIILIDGDEPLLINECMHATLNEPPNRPQDIIPSDISIGDLGIRLLQEGLFDPIKQFVIRSPWFLEKALSDDEFGKLQDICTQFLNTQHRWILYDPNKKWDLRLRQLKLFKKMGHIRSFASFKDWEQRKVYDWITQRVKKYGKTINSDAVMALEDVNRTNLSLLAQDIDTALTYCAEDSHITKSHITAISGSSSVTSFDFGEALKKRHLPDLLRISNTLIKNGESPIRLLGLTISSIRLYYQLLWRTAQGSIAATIAKQLGKHPFYISRLLDDISTTYSLDAFQEIFAYLHNTDLAIKTGRRSPEKALDLLLVHLCHRGNRTHQDKSIQKNVSFHR